MVETSGSWCPPEVSGPSEYEWKPWRVHARRRVVQRQAKQQFSFCSSNFKAARLWCGGPSRYLVRQEQGQGALRTYVLTLLPRIANRTASPDAAVNISGATTG